MSLYVLVLSACSTTSGPVNTTELLAPAATNLPDTQATHTLSPTVDALTATQTPARLQTVVFEPTLFLNLQNATVLPSLPPPRDPAGDALAHDLPDVGFIPADIGAWPWYEVKVADVMVAVPPDWIVIEWPMLLEGDSPVLYSASIMPEAYTDTDVYGFQAPAIGMTVYRYSVTTSLYDWIGRYATTEPFGSAACDDSMVWCGVTFLDFGTGDLASSALQSETMGISINTVLLDVHGVVLGLSHSHVGQVPFEPIFRFMLQNLTL